MAFTGSAWRGVAGCLVTFATAVLGAILGGFISWQVFRPSLTTSGGGENWHAFGDLFILLAQLAGGTLTGAVVGAGLGIAGSVAYFRRKPSGHCSACGYNLRGSSGSCPECGAATETKP